MSSIEDRAPVPVKLDKPLDWFAAGLNQQAKAIRFAEDENGNLWGFPAWLVGVNYAKTFIRVNTIEKANVDNVEEDQTGILTRSTNYVFKFDSKTWERQRTPTTFKTLADQTASGGVVWTPAGGKKYRLMGGVISLSKEAACAGMEYLTLADQGGTQILLIQISHVALVATGVVTLIPFSLPGNGYLSPTADNTLIVGLNGALTAGSYAACVWGTEE